MAAPTNDLHLTQALFENARALTGSDGDLDAALALVGDKGCVLIGEATHGTHEFSQFRCALTRRLIEEKGFLAVATEAGWPDAYRVNRYVRGLGSDGDAITALSEFRRFPGWMWRNADVLDFVGWLRARNEAVGPADRIGFYGLDPYSLHASIETILNHLDRLDPAAAARARRRYACFEQFGEDLDRYGYGDGLGLGSTSEHNLVEQLIALLQTRNAHLARTGLTPPDEALCAELAARTLDRAEVYFRRMLGGRIGAWNERDAQMAETLFTLRRHLGGERPAKLVVWAHNSHVGDARASEQGEAGELNLGQLLREQAREDVCILGLSTHDGAVTAASTWGGYAERKRVRPAYAVSYEALFHRVGLARFFLDLTRLGEAAGALAEPRLARAIGVVYLPRTERTSHYFHTCLPRQFDAIIHVDTTRALEPLERDSIWERGERPELASFDL